MSNALKPTSTNTLSARNNGISPRKNVARKNEMVDENPDVIKPTPGGGSQKAEERLDDENVEEPMSFVGTPPDRQRGYSNRPTRYHFDVDNTYERGIGETYEYTSHVAEFHILHEFDG